MNPMSDNVALARRYLAALEAQVAPSELAQFFAPDVVLALLPITAALLAGLLRAADDGDDW